ncbi:unnamed protein product, partial [marine sediment metagenome]
MKSLAVRILQFAVLSFSTMLFALTGQAHSASPKIGLTKVAENVYSFKYFIHRNMIVISDEGVILTDPMNAKAAKMMLA